MSKKLQAIGKRFYFYLKKLATAAKHFEFIKFFNSILKYSSKYFVSQSVTGYLTVHDRRKD
jgi:hypothetical protein